MLFSIIFYSCIPCFNTVILSDVTFWYTELVLPLGAHLCCLGFSNKDGSSWFTDFSGMQNVLDDEQLALHAMIFLAISLLLLSNIYRRNSIYYPNDFQSLKLYRDKSISHTSKSTTKLLEKIRISRSIEKFLDVSANDYYAFVL